MHSFRMTTPVQFVLCDSCDNCVITSERTSRHIRDVQDSALDACTAFREMTRLDVKNLIGLTVSILQSARYGWQQNFDVALD